MTFPTPIYLFIRPIHLKEIGGLYSIRYRLSSTLFYWSLNPNGHDPIPQAQWETYGIPILEVFLWIGASWYLFDYGTVGEHLRRQDASLDRRQYARDHGHSELLHGEYHLCA